jgi:DNA-binding PadR family transcriptional regulator
MNYRFTRAKQRKDRSMRRPPFRDHDGPPFGPPFGFGERHGRGSRRRGDIRTALLIALSEEPAHGYELIQRIEEKSGGLWRPSAGSVYPTLQLLEDEGLVTSTDRDGKRVFSITDDGRAQATERADAAGGAPWAREGRGDGGRGALWTKMRELQLAAKQVAVAGRPEQVERAAHVLEDARKRLYLLLGEE